MYYVNLVSILKILKTDGEIYPNAQIPHLTSKQAKRIFDACVFTKVLDERMLSSQRQGRISFYMTCTGEEAAVIGAAAGLDDQDMILAQYREHAALKYRGFSLESFMNQMFSDHLDLGKGRQMPVHYGSKALNYQTISSPLSTQIPQASGVAYAQKLKGEKQCTLCFFGEGAASEGDFHAGLNMAAVLSAPVIFFCRNNQYAISTQSDEQYAGDGIAPRGVGYGIRSIRVDGNDMLAVIAAVSQAREYVLKEQAPVLIEAMTYRVGAHSSSDDPSAYRSKQEEQAWREFDPVHRFKLWMINQGWLTEEESTTLYEHYKAEILKQMKASEKVAAPNIDQLIEDVYQEPTLGLKKQLEHLKNHIKKYPDYYPKTSGGL